MRVTCRSRWMYPRREVYRRAVRENKNTTTIFSHESLMLTEKERQDVLFCTHKRLSVHTSGTRTGLGRTEWWKICLQVDHNFHHIRTLAFVPLSMRSLCLMGYVLATVPLMAWVLMLFRNSLYSVEFGWASSMPPSVYFSDLCLSIRIKKKKCIDKYITYFAPSPEGRWSAPLFRASRRH